ncbi:putative oxalocrotonate tautomerase [Mycena metata]|uniref:Oxalocrotonate tautomerase n=1 Tax=Mycena metata TaxID=1033252 RepID=A0AAD7MUF3_9AGAR|nr:putative oxalocrotonate tautomerase [Mycena metata]
MPLHRFFTPKGLYSREDKAAIAAAVTGVYASLPPFYVVVLFIDIDIDSYFVGGKSTDKFLRIGVEHIARNFSDDKSKRSFMDRYEKALEPFTAGRGIDWEVQITDDDRMLWNENGMPPPPANSEEEKLWKEENRAVPFEEMEVLKKERRHA